MTTRAEEIAGELSDEVIDRIGIDIETELASADWPRGSVVAEVENFKRYARRLRLYLKPSQAIGEQTPVAWMSDCCNSEMRQEVDNQQGPIGDVCLKCKHYCTPIPLYRCPITPEARDRAIEALERTKSLLDAVDAIVNYGLVIKKEAAFHHNVRSAITEADQALSALCGS